MVAYKLVNQRKDKSLGPLFINRRLRYKMNTWHEAENHPTKGYASRPGFHCTLKPHAPHLKNKPNRVWVKCLVEDYTTFNRPENQGGTWLIANKIKPIELLTNK